MNIKIKNKTAQSLYELYGDEKAVKKLVNKFLKDFVKSVDFELLKKEDFGTSFCMDENGERKECDGKCTL